MERQQEYKCKMCGETFSSDGELDEHNSRAHGMGKGGKKEEKTNLE